MNALECRQCNLFTTSMKVMKNKIKNATTFEHFVTIIKLLKNSEFINHYSPQNLEFLLLNTVNSIIEKDINSNLDALKMILQNTV